ncbi:MAG: asparagine synthase (glutamine-hydrolyzing), partial [Gammaproteobacteria bacterium]
MCGITGILSIRGTDSAVIAAMTSVLTHRGPDARNIWQSPDRRLAFGHQRLSVIDLSDAGAQPMHSAGERFCIIYNGEVYNTRGLRDDLEKAGIRFRGHSDTEVILEACALYGVETTVNKLIGMFAFALWDKAEEVLYLVRDRLGIKPLYWGEVDGIFLFASELKSLRQHPGWKPEIDRSALSQFMRYGFIPAPATIYKGIFKLQPGSILTMRTGARPEINRYWSMETVARNGIQNRIDDETQAIRNLETSLDEAVSARMIADVPLGAFLSGGIDSSLVVALMQKHSALPVKTFTIGFHEPSFDEAVYAGEIA